MKLKKMNPKQWTGLILIVIGLAMVAVPGGGWVAAAIMFGAGFTLLMG